MQYPVVELAVGLLFLGNFLLYGGAGAAEWPSGPEALASPRWIVGAVFTTLLLAIAVTDVRTYLIPNELSLGGALLGLVLSALPGGVTVLHSFLGALLGAALLLGVAWVGRIVFGREAMGMGDVKMMAMVGAFVGWEGVFLTVFLGALLGTLVYGPFVLVQRLMARRRPSDAGTAPVADGAGGAERTSPAAPGEDAADQEVVDRELVPFGFFLAPAAALAYYLGEDLVRGYLRLTGLAACAGRSRPRTRASGRARASRARFAVRPATSSRPGGCACSWTWGAAVSAASRVAASPWGRSGPWA